MYGKYGEIAIEATRKVWAEKKDPENAWKEAAAKIFYYSHSSKTKPCPRNAYTGLCEDGLVVGIKCTHVKGGKNKSYAVHAVHMLCRNPSLGNDRPTQLWRKVMGEMGIKDKQHNGQMDVVLALWDKDMIEREGIVKVM